ncbi:hypothetical protein Tco_0300318 [Tanacetum coccineum]
MDFQNELNCLKEMLNLRNSNQDPPVDFYDLKGSDEGNNEINSLTKEPSDTFLMRDEFISTTPERENDKFIKSSFDNLVPIPRESEVTSVCDDLECDMPATIPLPTTSVIEEDFDINSPLGEQVVDFLIENVDVADLPRHMVKQLFGLLVKNLSSTKRMSDEPLGDDSKPRSYDVTFSNPLFEFNDEFILCNDNPLFDEEFTDISSLDPPKNGPLRALVCYGPLRTLRPDQPNNSSCSKTVSGDDLGHLSRPRISLPDIPLALSVPIPQPLAVGATHPQPFSTPAIGAASAPLWLGIKVGIGLSLDKSRYFPGNPDSVSRSLKTSDLILEVLTAEIGLEDSIPTEIDDGYYDSEGTKDLKTKEKARFGSVSEKGLVRGSEKGSVRGSEKVSVPGDDPEGSRR